MNQPTLELPIGEGRDWEDMMAEALREEVVEYADEKLMALNTATQVVLDFYRVMGDRNEMDVADCVADLTLLYETASMELSRRYLAKAMAHAEAQNKEANA